MINHLIDYFGLKYKFFFQQTNTSTHLQQISINIDCSFYLFKAEKFYRVRI